MAMLLQDEKQETFGQKIIVKDLSEDYDFIEQVGQGFTAEVWLVVKKQTKEQFAIKKIYKNKLQFDKSKYLLQEVYVLKSMEHENTVKFIEQAEWDICQYIVMEYCEQNLKTFLHKKGPLGMSEKEALEVFFQILKGLLYLHGKGFIHRDIKLENILVKELSQNQYVFKIGDFGFSKQPEGGNQQPQDQTNVGTQEYMSPEQLQGIFTNCKIDIWAMGVVLIQLLLGDEQYPFEGNVQEFKNHFTKNKGLFNLKDIFDPQQIFEKHKLLQEKLSQQEEQIIKERYNKILKISPNCMDLIQKIMVFDFNLRIETIDILEHQVFSQFLGTPNEIIKQSQIYNNKLDQEYSFQIQRFKFLKNLINQIKQQSPEIIVAQNTICYFLNKTQLFYQQNLLESFQNQNLRYQMFGIGKEWWDVFQKSQKYQYYKADLASDILICQNEINNKENKQNVLAEIAQINQSLSQNYNQQLQNQDFQQFKYCFREINQFVMVKIRELLNLQYQQKKLQDIELVKLMLKIQTASIINQMKYDYLFISDVFNLYISEKPEENSISLNHFFDNYNNWINQCTSKNRLIAQYTCFQNYFFSQPAQLQQQQQQQQQQ